MCHMIVGSMSRHKLEAVRRACSRIGMRSAIVSGMRTDSGQNEQPVGFDETFDGALARARSVKDRYPDRVAIGVESGILRIGEGDPITCDMAVIVVLAEPGVRIVTTSSALVIPERFVEMAESRGFGNTTMGSVIASELGGDPADPHSLLTGGRVSRVETLADALCVALRQVLIRCQRG